MHLHPPHTVVGFQKRVGPHHDPSRSAVGEGMVANSDTVIWWRAGIETGVYCSELLWYPSSPRTLTSDRI